MGTLPKENVFLANGSQVAQIGSAISKKYPIPVGVEFIIADLDDGHQTAVLPPPVKLSNCQKPGKWTKICSSQKLLFQTPHFLFQLSVKIINWAKTDSVAFIQSKFSVFFKQNLISYDQRSASSFSDLALIDMFMFTCLNGKPSKKANLRDCSLNGKFLSSLIQRTSCILLHWLWLWYQDNQNEI